MEDYLKRLGLAPSVSDADLAQAYEAVPAPEKGLIKNAAALAYLVWRPWTMVPHRVVDWGSVSLEETARPAHWALFLYHPQRFPILALTSAVVAALMARVPHVIVVAQPPVDRALLFALDFLSVPLLYHADRVHVAELIAALGAVGEGPIIDLGLGGVPATLRFCPEDYMVVDTLPPSPQAEAYGRVMGSLRHTDPGARAQWYLAYGADPAVVAARYHLTGRLVGGWPWDRLSPEDFLLRTMRFA